MIDNLSSDINEYMPLRDVVFKTIRQGILKGDLMPGERLMEIALAKKLGVSRTPIREAIRMLELEGLVVMAPRKGAMVAGITEKNLRDVLEVRKALEELAIELACERMNEEDIRELDLAMDDFKKAVEKMDLIEIAKSDEHFHDVIFKSTDNDKLMLLVGNLREQMYRYRIEYIKDADKRALFVTEHEGILKALKERDVVMAKEQIRQHIDNQETTVAKNLKEK